MKGIGARQAIRISETPNAQVYNYRYAAGGGVNRWGGAYGGAYQYRENPRASLALEGQQRSRIRTQERIRGYGSANSIAQSLEAEIAQVRVQLTEKYGIEF